MINTSDFYPEMGRSLSFIMLSLLCGCSILAPDKTPPPNLYTLDIHSSTSLSQQPPLSTIILGAPTIMVSIPRAAAGFDSHQIAYIRQAHQLEYFRLSEWIASPAEMLTPVIVSALERSGKFSAVLQAPASSVGQFRLEVEIIRLQQEFFTRPSQVHFTLRAHLLDSTMRHVIAWQEFDSIVTAASDDPYGGVIASNTVVQKIVKELADFCAQAVKLQKPRICRQT